MKPQIEILAAYTFTIIASLIIASLIHSSIPSVAPQVFAQPTSALLYVAYIATVGILLAIVLKFKKRIIVALEPLIKYYKTHKRAINTILSLILIILVVLLIIKYPELALALGVYTAIFLIAYLIIKRFIKHVNINVKVAFILFQILIIVVLGYEFTPETVLIFIAALAIYDFIAVFVTKHMLILAEHMSNPFLIYKAVELKAKPESSINGETLKSVKAEIKDGKTCTLVDRHGTYSIAEVSIDQKLKRRVSDIWSVGTVPVLNTMGLGGGDFMAAGVVVLTMFLKSHLLGALYLNGAIIGLIITFVVSNKLKRPLPAIPLICIGFGISLLLSMIL
jgi:presenilin-like A22 family membrane protease